MFRHILYIGLLVCVLHHEFSGSQANATPLQMKSNNLDPEKTDQQDTEDNGIPKAARQDEQSTHSHHVVDSPVAFSAVCTKQLDYFPGSTVIFDELVTNEGGRYANNTGQFACLDDDVYVFTWALTRAQYALAGMRVIGRLDAGLDLIKIGPRTSHRDAQYSSGTAEMASLARCRTSIPTAIKVAIEPWSANEPVTLYTQRPGFSGFKLGHPQLVVGFVAELSEETYKFPGDTIKFDLVLQNYGGHYDDITGVFTCPDNFTYVFMVSTHCQDPQTPWSVSRLMMDNEQILMGPVTYPVTQHDSGSASITAITRCQHNKHVYVEAAQADDFPYNSYAPRLTSFTGFRVHGEEDDGVAFMAVLAANFTPPAGNTPIIMDEVLLNIGEAYDSLIGSFVCPDTNLYMFSFTAVTDHGTHSQIMMEDDVIRYNRNTGLDVDGTSGSSTVSVIIRCQLDNRIHVEHQSNQRTYLAQYTSFSGYKLPGENPID